MSAVASLLGLALVAFGVGVIHGARQRRRLRRLRDLASLVGVRWTEDDDADDLTIRIAARCAFLAAAPRRSYLDIRHN